MAGGTDAFASASGVLKKHDQKEGSVRNKGREKLEMNKNIEAPSFWEEIGVHGLFSSYNLI